MTRDRLRQYESLIQELTEEQERLAREIRQRRHNEALLGVGYLLGEDAVEAAASRVQELAARREDEIAEVRGWIARQSDSMTRRALRLRYIDGLPWAEIARRMGYADESGPRKLVGLLW